MGEYFGQAIDWELEGYSRLGRLIWEADGVSRDRFAHA